MTDKLYLECYAGISGDMMVAALLDLGAEEQVLRDALLSLPLEGFQIKISRVKKAGIDACDFDVILDEKYQNHDHDMEYLHGHSHVHTAEEEMPHEHVHNHTHRRLQDVLHIIHGADLSDRARQMAISVFEILAKAEAKAHGTTIEKVHFHEVGAVDSIVDIVAVSVCLDNLGITEVVIPVLYEGCGFIRCQHGMMPVPVPAVANIAADTGLTLHRMDIQGEFVTPTGAAIAAAIQTTERLPQNYKIEKIGIGAGKRNYERPSLLRAMLISEEEKEADTICKLECNVDDSSGEALGYCMEQLFAAGARDVSYIPLFMKKNRPAYQLNVICKEEDVSKLEEVIFAETTTIGIRRVKMERTILEREILSEETSLGQVQVKKCRLKNTVHRYPEYESVRKIAQQTEIPFIQAYQQIMRELNEKNV